MKIRKAIKLATDGARVRMKSWYPGDYLYHIYNDGYWISTPGPEADKRFVVHPEHVRADEWEVCE